MFLSLDCKAAIVGIDINEMALEVVEAALALSVADAVADLVLLVPAAAVVELALLAAEDPVAVEALELLALALLAPAAAVVELALLVAEAELALLVAGECVLLLH